MTTDTSERGLERLICSALTGSACEPGVVSGVAEPAISYGGAGYLCGSPADYDRDHALDLAQLSTFLDVTQPTTSAALDLDGDSPARLRFLARLQGEVARRGTIEVLRHGIKHGQHSVDDARGNSPLLISETPQVSRPTESAGV
jgi:type I restriction enzyme R subunit